RIADEPSGGPSDSAHRLSLISVTPFPRESDLLAYAQIQSSALASPAPLLRRGCDRPGHGQRERKAVVRNPVTTTAQIGRQQHSRAAVADCCFAEAVAGWVAGADRGRRGSQP